MMPLRGVIIGRATTSFFLAAEQTTPPPADKGKARSAEDIHHHHHHPLKPNDRQYKIPGRVTTSPVTGSKAMPVYRKTAGIVHEKEFYPARPEEAVLL